MQQATPTGNEPMELRKKKNWDIKSIAVLGCSVVRLNPIRLKLQKSQRQDVDPGGNITDSRNSF